MAERPPALPPCRVCGDKGSGFHYGVNTCEACKGFFHRSLRRQKDYKCRENRTSGFCPYIPGKRHSCQFCRHQRCLQAGMSKEAIKTGRYTYKKRSSDRMEVQQLLPGSKHRSLPNPDVGTIDFKNEGMDFNTFSNCHSPETTDSAETTNHSFISTIDETCSRTDNSSSIEGCSSYNSHGYNGSLDNSPFLSHSSESSHAYLGDSTAGRRGDLPRGGSCAFCPLNVLGTGEPQSEATDLSLFKAPSKTIPNLPSMVVGMSSGGNCSSPEFHGTNVVSSSNDDLDSLSMDHDILKSSDHGMLKSPDHGMLKSPDYDMLKSPLTPCQSLLSGDTDESLSPLYLSHTVHDRDHTASMADLEELYQEPDAVMDQLMRAFNTNLKPLFELPPNELQELQKKHLESCALKSQEFGSLKFLSEKQYDEIYQMTGIDVDGRRRILRVLLDFTERCVRAMVKFAKAIPGFGFLDLETQASLVKLSRQEFTILGSYISGQSDHQVFLSVVGRWACKFEMEQWTDQVPGMIFLKLCERIRNLKPSREELVLLKAMLVVTTDRDNTIHSPLADAIHRKLCHTLRHVIGLRHEQPDLLMRKYKDILVESRVVSETLHGVMKGVDITKYSSILHNPLLIEIFSRALKEHSMSDH